MRNQDQKPPDFIESQVPFVNPYHFVPLPERCDRTAPCRGNLTGWIDVTLTTKSPLFIPNTRNDDAFPHLRRCAEGIHAQMKGNRQNRGHLKSYDFFSYDSENEPFPTRNPVLPGSELRGMLRSAFEAVTFSCVSSVNDDQILYRRTTLPGDPGRIEKNGDQWQLRRMHRVMIKTLTDSPTRNDRNLSFLPRIRDMGLNEGDPVYISESSANYDSKIKVKFVNDLSEHPSNTCRTLGYFHKAEPFGKRKHHESIFVDAGHDPLPLSEEQVKEMYRGYKATIDLYWKNGNGYDHLREELRTLRGFENCLVYYREVHGHYYLSPAAIGREVFRNRLRDLLGKFSPCGKEEDVCPACNLFGMTGDHGSLCSRIRVTDAAATTGQQDLFMEPLVPEQLASPKISAAEFYLEAEPAADLWNYDYAAFWATPSERSPDAPEPGSAEPRGLAEEQGFTPVPKDYYTPRLLGRKFYWHQKIKEVAGHPFYNQSTGRNPPARTPPKLDQFVGIRPLRPNKSFHCRVYFEDLTDWEIKTLAWVIHHGGEQGCGHKLGMGKPLGLGSIQCRIDAITVRSLNLEPTKITYHTEERRADFVTPEAAPSHTAAKVFLRICRLDATQGQNVCYPRMEAPPDGTLTYAWFMANRLSKQGSTGIKHMMDQRLEPLTGDVHQNAPPLKAYKKNPAAEQWRREQQQRRRDERGGGRQRDRNRRQDNRGSH